MRRSRTRAQVALMSAALALMAACEATPSPTPSPVPTMTPVATATPSPTATATSAPSPTATPEPELSLDLPEDRDGRMVSVEVAPDLGAGRIVVTVTSAADSLIDELVLRWPTDLDDALLLAPFVPSDDRIREGGQPLVVPWTKWVVGPGERGEPAGTTSLGYGPLLAGGRLVIPLEIIERAADRPVAFDLQVLAGNAILDLTDGEPAELRVELP